MHHVSGDIWRSFGSDEYAAGFYFADETGCLNGPYATLEAAQAALDLYIEHFINRAPVAHP